MLDKCGTLWYTIGNTKENDYEQKKRMMLIKALEDANVDFDSSVETAELERIFSELQKGENNNSDNKDDEMSDQEKLFNIANESISENLDNDKALAEKYGFSQGLWFDSLSYDPDMWTTGKTDKAVI